MSVNYGLLTKYLGLSVQDEVSELGFLKKVLKDKGVNQRGWRLYLDYGDSLFPTLANAKAPAFVLQSNAARAIQWLRIVQACEMDVPPPLILCKSAAKWPWHSLNRTSVPHQFLKTIWKSLVLKEYSGEDIREYLDQDVQQVAIWYISDGGIDKVSEPQLKAGWKSIWSAYEEDIQSRLNIEKYSWNSWVNIFESDGKVFKALNSPYALVAERAVMEHCIANYLHDCRKVTLGCIQ